MSGFSRTEKKNISIISALYAVRMLGLFMILPVFMLAGASLEGATPLLLGLALGVYGLSQAFFQIPFGALSDRFGRKPILLAGLLLFALGGAIAGLSESVYGVIFGRFLQGAGAIASVLMALLGDLTREENRTRAMATVGMTIGLSFALSLVIGPLLLDAFGLSGLFFATTLAGLLGVAVLPKISTPIVEQRRREYAFIVADIRKVLGVRELLRLNVGIFSLHLLMTAIFIVVPHELADKHGVPLTNHGTIYLSIMLTAFVCMVPFIIWGERRGKVRTVFLSAISLIALAYLGLWFGHESYGLFLAMLFLFFLAFNYLEATLPSLVSRIVPAGYRGSAMGVYSSAQFFGAFLGGLLGGAVYTAYGLSGVYGMSLVISLLWACVALGMLPPPNTRSIVAPLKPFEPSESSRILASFREMAGVEDVTLVIEEQAAYLKVDKGVFDDEALMRHPLTQ